jgi:hypothetical protein
MIASVLVVAALILWHRSYRQSDRLAFHAYHSRITLRSSRGRLQMLTPPSNHAGRQASELASRLRNRDIRWDLKTEKAYEFPANAKAPTYSLSISPRAAEGSAGADLLKLGTAAHALLLRAMDDPSQFGAAHVLLTLIGGKRHSFAVISDSHIALDTMNAATPVNIDGLAVVLHHPDFDYGLDAVDIDPAQLPKLRDSWHAKLDVQVVSVSYGWIAIVMLLIPANRIASIGRRRWRLHRKRCPACGYDLRATPNQCPECGAAADRLTALVVYPRIT